MEERLKRADRLFIITQRIGYALWQLQELEGACATHYVLMEEATFGMGEEAGTALEAKAMRKTFGSTIHKMTKSGLLTSNVESRFTNLLSERNWLVHRSRADSRNAIHHETKMDALLERLELITSESLSLLNHIGTLNEDYGKKYGVSDKYLKHKSAEILEQWHSESVI